MAGYMGADTDALRDMAEVFRTSSQRMQDLRTTLDSAVQREEIWIGSDAEDFRDRWRGVSSELENAASRVGSHRTDLEQQAEDQDQTSDEGGGGGGGDGGPFGPIGDFFATLKEYGGDIAKALRKFQKGIDAFRMFHDLSKLGKAGYEGLKGLIESQYIDELADLTRGPANKIMDFVNGKGWTKVADFAEGILDSGVVKGAGQFLSKALPVLDIGMGIHQIATAEDGWDVASGGLSVASGALLLAAPFAGPFAPVLVGASAVAGGVSLAIDAGKAIYENWDSITETAGDAWNATTEFAGDAWDSATETAGEAWDTAKDVVSDPIGAIGSLF